MEIPQERLVLLGKFQTLRVQIDADSILPTGENTPVTNDDETKSSFVNSSGTASPFEESSLVRSRRALSNAVVADEWDDAFVREEILVVDYVTWFNSWDAEATDECNDSNPCDSSDEDLFEERPRMSSAAMQTTRTTVRHALLLTYSTLYLIEVQLQTELCNQPRQQFLTEDFEDFEEFFKTRSQSYEERYASILERSKISELHIVCRLEPSDIFEISLPYKTISLPNGEEFAERSADLVVTTTTDTHFWLQFHSNEARGSMVEFLQDWYLRVVPKGKDLMVSQVLDKEILTAVESEENINSASDLDPKLPSNLKHRQQHHPYFCTIM